MIKSYMATYLEGREYDALRIFDIVNCQESGKFDQEIAPVRYGCF